MPRLRLLLALLALLVALPSPARADGGWSQVGGTVQARQAQRARPDTIAPDATRGPRAFLASVGEDGRVAAQRDRHERDHRAGAKTLRLRSGSATGDLSPARSRYRAALLGALDFSSRLARARIGSDAARSIAPPHLA